MEEWSAPPVELQVWSAARIDLSSNLRDRGPGTQYWLDAGGAWRVGRSRRCELPLPSQQSLSSVALVLTYAIIKAPRGPLARVSTIVLQRGSGKALISASSGDVLLLARGAPRTWLRPSCKYTIVVGTPHPTVELRFCTPDETDVRPRQDLTSGTQTWTVTGRGNRGFPGWVDVAALTVVIDQHPEVLPLREDGTPVSPSMALRLLGELFCGQTSNSYYQERLTEALDAAGIRVGSNQDKQSRVALYYGPWFGPEKIVRLRDRFLDLGTRPE
jgi:hypothetical protein